MAKTERGAAGVVQAQMQAPVEDRWWIDWGDEEADEELLQPTSLWEAEITALDDEHLLALEESAEDV